MKRAREERVYANVVCLVRGFGDDPRELWDIPDARAFCRRLFGQGFASYLDLSTRVGVSDATLAGALGALEVWMCADGLMRTGPVDLWRADWDRFLADLETANAVADAAMGAFGGGTA